ncbi:MAG: DedA family protein [Candidatus Aenigmarchaeota archaeon]|nr:DedA family protein [Candidatus Aenigmarchaeota archaeon]
MDFVSMFFHLDEFMASAVSEYGIWAYAILFLIIFIETGIVIAPFLPGDSLIFLAGTFAALGSLDIAALFGIMTAAAIIGDSVNYYIGSHAGNKVLEGRMPYVRKEHLDNTRRFYEKHGGKTIIMARFLPIIRTFAPFVAGVAGMKYATFIAYNVVGAMLWVASFLALGYFLGNVPLVRENLELMVLAIIALSVLPAVAGFIRSRKTWAK